MTELVQRAPGAPDRRGRTSRIDWDGFFGNGRRLAGSMVTVVAIAALAVALVAIIASDDPRTARGDESSYVLDALSIMGGNLSFDGDDHARWVELGWDRQPAGLFLQANDDGWAAAKPIGYSVLLAPFLAAFGLTGIRYLGAILLVCYAGAWYASCRLRWSRSTSASVAVAASVGSYAWFYAFPAMADLFLAALIGFIVHACVRAVVTRNAIWFWISAAASALLLTEKVPALLALLPLLVAVGYRMGCRNGLIGAGLLVAVAALSTIPYFYYSDGASWSPYGGERYYAATTTPWSGGTPGDLVRTTTDEKISVSYAVERLSAPSPDLPSAAVTYVVGRHTGALTFMPIAPLLVGASASALILRRHRRTRVAADSKADEEVGERPDTENLDTTEEDRTRVASDALVASAGLVSMMAYAAFYLILFTHNYYGGGQSIGSRYFLQFSAVAVVAPVAANVNERVIAITSAVAAVWALVVLGPIIRHAPDMYREFWRTGPVQRFLPYDSTQDHLPGLWTGPEDTAWNRRSRRWAGAQVFAQTGRVVGDTRVAEAGIDTAGFVAFGPYDFLADGRYRATFNYSSEGSIGEVVGLADAAVNGISAASIEVGGTEGVEASVSIEFTAETIFGWEFRLLWSGQADITLRSIDLIPIGQPR